jgi:putative ABC transport system permease protein
VELYLRLARRLLPGPFLKRYGKGIEEALRQDLGAVPSGFRRWARLGRAMVDLLLVAVRLRLNPPAGPNGPRPAGHPGGEGMMGTLAYDVRMAARALRRSPGFSLVVAGTLAVAIGANTAIFGVVQGVIVRPLPYDEPDRLVAVWSRWNVFPKTWVSDAEYRIYANGNRTLSSLGAWAGTSVTFTDPSAPERVRAALVDPSLLPTLGVVPAVGRPFTREEHRDSGNAILIGHGLWERRFAADRAVVGREVEVDGTLRRVAGVLPQGFQLPTDFGSGGRTEVLLPGFVDLDPAIPVPSNGGSHSLYVAARLHPGVAVEEARADLERLVDDLEAEGVYAPERAFNVLVFDLASDVLGPVRRALWVLLGAVFLVLLIACGNVASLVLARGRARAGEMALRAAVGASRGRVLRQLLVEYGLLTAVAGGAGLALGVVLMGSFLALDPGSIPRGADVTPGLSMVLWAAGLTVVTLLVAGLAPALRALGDAPSGLLREGRRDTGGRRLRRGRGVLVATQVSLAVTLLVGAGLMVRTFAGLSGIATGFDAARTLTLRLNLPAVTYPDVAATRQLHDDVLRQVRALPGVEAAGFARSLPLASEIGDWGMQVEGYTPSPGESMGGDWQVVTEGYVEAMGIPVLEGRAFESGDDSDLDQLVVNRALVDRFFRGRPALGSRIFTMGDTSVVIGVVGNVTHNGLQADVKPKFYRLQRQLPDGLAGSSRSMSLVVRTAADDPYALLPPIREVIRRRDPTLAVAEVQTMDEVVERALGQPRLLLTLLGAFAGVALLLAVVGVYGVMAYSVAQRTREIGVRMALGARREKVTAMVIREGMTMALAGLGVGLLAAAGLGHLLEGLLYGVPARDPATFGAVACLFAAVSLVAAGVPAWRASRTDPVEALREGY